MRATILQTDIKWNQPEANIDNAERLMAGAPRSDIYVLPEMWDTGFITERELLENRVETSARTLEWMRNMAATTGGAVCGSVATKNENGRFVNRFYFVLPNGSCSYYDKRHLFAYGGEDKHYERGTRRVIVNHCGIRLLLAVCYDLRFPVWLRNDNDYDAILLTANWPESRREVWKTLLRARAIENQCFVIGTNRTGSDPVCKYAGDSMIVDAKGRVLAESVTGKEQTVTVDMDIQSLRQFRNKFPVLDDRDSFCLNQ